MIIPDSARTRLFETVWGEADRIDWIRLNTNEKRKYYETWTRDESIGGLLRRYLDAGKVRVYLKDTVLKEYTRNRLSAPERIYRVLGLDAENARESYEKPHGHRLEDGRILCWGKASDWKTVLLATFERAYAKDDYQAFAAVLLFSTGKFHEVDSRIIVQDVANRLGIQRLEWLD